MQSTPRPIGYVELQRAWIGEKPNGMTEGETIMAHQQDAIAQMAREDPALAFDGSRLEHTYDGAGVNHFTLYVGFTPRRAADHEPLNPRNLNDAPHAEQIGDPARDFSVGMKEQRF